MLPPQIGQVAFIVCKYKNETCNKGSLEKQTAPFCSTGCIASPACGREGLATLAELL